MKSAMLVIIAIGIAALSNALHIENGGYKDVIVEISDTVPARDCSTILTQLEKALPSASSSLFNALDGRAYIDSVVVMIPKSWPMNCLPHKAPWLPSRGEPSDITITNEHPIYGNEIWTQQSGGCYENGDQIYASYAALNRESAGKELVREFAKYRYGIFDETGYKNDPIYPICYENETGTIEVTGCSEYKIHDNGICKNEEGRKNALLDDAARSSIMFNAEAAVMFCDNGTHNRFAPTKHNQMCDRKPTLDVILEHKDFKNKLRTSVVNSSPTIIYKQRMLTRYVVIIDETMVTMPRESYKYLRTALSKWIVSDLPNNTEVGIVLAADLAWPKIFNVSSLSYQCNRQAIAAFIPFTPAAGAQSCLECAMRDGLSMLKEKYNSASSVIVVVAPGIDSKIDTMKLATEFNKEKVKLVTINYPGIERRKPLDTLAAATTLSSSYTVYDMKQNADKTLLTTYFDLCNIFRDITLNHYEGNKFDLPMEIHRKELVDIHDDHSGSGVKKMSRNITSTFMLEYAMGTPLNFFLYTHNWQNPLIQSITLTSPSGNTSSLRTEQWVSMKLLSLLKVIAETGTWTYTIDRINGNPQPHFVQVIATPKSTTSQVIVARAWVKNKVDSIGALVLYVEVKRASVPILSAFVEATIYNPDEDCKNVSGCQQKIRLLDTGSGDPDVLKGDGIYTRYVNVPEGKSRAYKIDIIVTDNGSTAYSMKLNGKTENSKCCGSVISIPDKYALPSFQRYLPSLNVFVHDRIPKPKSEAVGRIGDLQAKHLDGNKVNLSWTSPDMAGLAVGRYEVKYASTLTDLIDRFDTAAVLWNHTRALAFPIGDITSMTMDLNKEPALIGQPIYVALRALRDDKPGPVSNYVRVNSPKLVTSKAVPRNPTNSVEEEKTKNVTEQTITVGDSAARIAAHGYWHTVGLIVIIIISLLSTATLWYYERATNQLEQEQHSVSAMRNSTNSLNSEQYQRTDDSSYRAIPDPNTVGLPLCDPDDDEYKQAFAYPTMDQRLYQANGFRSATELLVAHARQSPSEICMTANETGHFIGDRSDQLHTNYEMVNMSTPPPLPPIPYQETPHSVPRRVCNNVYNNESRMEEPPPYIATLSETLSNQQQFNPSLQGSMNSVNSGEREKTSNSTIV